MSACSTHESAVRNLDRDRCASFFKNLTSLAQTDVLSSRRRRRAGREPWVAVLVVSGSVDVCWVSAMGSDHDKRPSRGGAWRARGMARSLYVRLVTDTKFATRALAIAVVALALCSFGARQAHGVVERLSGARVGPPTQQCGASKYGFLRANSCHPFSLPHQMKRVDARPKRCGRFTLTSAGFCLCDDDERATVIAAPKGCGTEPVMCEKACKLKPIVGRKLPACSAEDAKPRAQCARRGAVTEPSPETVALLDELARAMGEPLGVKMPPGSRRDLYTDFVMYGRRMSQEAVRETRRRTELFKKMAPAYPERAFAGRGIVIVGGNQPKFQTSYWVAIHALRRSGCALPIQLWFPEREGPDCERADELRRMGVTIHSFADLVDADAAGGAHGAAAMTNRFMYKIVALVFSSFREVLLMDSDNIVLSDPSSLFASELYESRGSILWMDFWRGSAAPDLASVLGAGAAANHTHESGQMVMDKKRTWEALRLALFFNAHADVFYPLTVNYMGLGDKEIVSTAFLHLRTPYGVAPHGPDHVGVRDHDRAETLGNTMMQHDMDGTPMFLHANLGKPMGFVPADASAYVRRWQISNGRGLDLPRALNDAADTEDFEMWYYDLLRRRRCWFDGRPAKHWYHTLGFGPFVEGFHVSDHYNVNDALESFRGMVDAGIVFG